MEVVEGWVIFLVLELRLTAILSKNHLYIFIGTGLLHMITILAMIVDIVLIEKFI
jgi:hypothetical protein